MSAPLMNRLIYTAPDISTLFNGTPMSTFESLNEVQMHLEVRVPETGVVLACQRADRCRVRYRWDYTPVIHHMVPAIVYPGMQVSVGLDANKAPNYKADNQMMVDIRIDGTSLDFEGWYDKESTLSQHEV